MDKCAFCIAEIKKRAIETGRYAIVVLSKPRLVPGHILIIPKKHVQIFSDLKNAEILEIFKFIAKYQDIVLKKLGRGVEIRQNFQPYKKIGITHVNHLHIHILPRDENDELSKKVDDPRRDLFTDLTKEEEQKITKLLK